jgi:hypothetical protein
LTLGADGRLDWPAGAWPPFPEHADHIWYYQQTLNGRLKPLETPIMVGGRNILHADANAAEPLIDVSRLKKLPLFSKIMGPDAATFDVATGKVAAVSPRAVN